MSRVIPFPALAAVDDECCSVSFPVSLHEAVASCRRRYRTLIAAAGEWAMARGVPLPADHVALWAAACDELGCAGDLDGMSGPWRASALPDFLANIADWCAAAGCPLPANLGESLWHLYGFLASTGRFHPASDALAEIRASLVVFGTRDRLRLVPPPTPGPTAA